MAEKIVSPGVFTRERDLSFLPAGISAIGAAIIGPTVKGPAFEPVIIESFKEFELVFGPKTLDSYVPYTVEGYLKSAGRVTVVRTLGLSGYTPRLVAISTVESSAGNLSSAGGTGDVFAVLHPTQVDADASFGVLLNDGAPEVAVLHLSESKVTGQTTTSGANNTGSYADMFFTLESPDLAGGANDKFGFYFTASFLGGVPDNFQAGAPSGLTSLTTVYNSPITLVSQSKAADGVNNITGSMANAIAHAINAVTSSVNSKRLFNARIVKSGTLADTTFTYISGTVATPALGGNALEITNKFTGDVAQSTGGAATMSFTYSGAGGDTTVNGSIDGDSFTLYLADDANGDGVTTYNPTADGFTGDTDTGNILTSNTTYSSSIDTTGTNWIGKVFGSTPKDRNKPVYNYLLFKNYASRSYSADSSLTVTTANSSNNYNTIYAEKDAYEARTPFIVSQNLGSYASPKTTRLFKFHTRSHGPSTNYQYKVAISNVKAPSAVAGSDYGTFSIAIRRVDVEGTIHAQNTPYAKSSDKDLRPHIVEQWSNLTLDPNSPNFIARVIGDRYQKIDANGKVTVFGDYPNLSRHVWVEVPEEVKDQGTSPDLVPFGFEALFQPVVTGVGTLPTASFIGHTNNDKQLDDAGHFVKKTQMADNVYNKKIHYGFNYLDTDNLNYLMPLPFSGAVNGNNKHFNLSDCVQHPSASLANGATSAITTDGSTINLATKKFIVPFQGGFDGLNPARYIARGTDIVATNMLGFDLSTAEKDGSLAYKRAINAVSNPDEYDINLMITPGPNHRLHSVVTTHAKNTCEDRSDALYIMDPVGKDTTTISTVTNTVKSLDSNYTATYWPWVKILDTDKNRPVWVPPSTVLAGVISKNDQVAFEWFAPAGLNRGMLTEAIDVPTRLTHAERDDLYEGRVNPIAVYKEGITVWGQKTLQARPSALDRINVRRLLIAAKKFIASATKFLVFENNTNATRQRFLNIANPYFESVQQRQGLYAYKVIMDATNNTPDVIDRNQMIGEIFLQPAKSAEFIILDFNILPTGAVFPE